MMTIHEYALPNPESRPRRIAITPDDAIWYTDYAGGHLGRFDPKTGNASEWPSPGGVNSGPYGTAVVKDVLWYSESGVSPNTLVRFDPAKHIAPPQIQTEPVQYRYYGGYGYGG